MRARGVASAIVVLALASLAVACGDDGDEAVDDCESDDVVVDTGDNFFEPAELEIPAGTTVCWPNVGRTVHNVVPDEGEDFGISTFEPGEAYRHTFDEPGEHPYYCSFHGAAGLGQWGTILVTE